MQNSRACARCLRSCSCLCERMVSVFVQPRHAGGLRVTQSCSLRGVVSRILTPKTAGSMRSANMLCSHAADASARINAEHEPEHTQTQYIYVLSLCASIAVAVLSISDNALAVAGCCLGTQHGRSPRRLYPSQRHLRNTFWPCSGGHRRTAASMQRHKHAAAGRRGPPRHAQPRSRPRASTLLAMCYFERDGLG